MRNIRAILNLTVSITLTVVTALAHAERGQSERPPKEQTSRGGAGPGGGAGPEKPSGAAEPISNIPGAIQYPPVSKFATIPPELRQQAREKAETFLRPLLSPKDFKRILDALANRDYIRVDAIPPRVSEKIMADYRNEGLAQKFPNLKIVAYTENSKTYYIDAFLKDGDFEKIIFMFHEAYYALLPDAKLGSVMYFEEAINKFLRNPNSIENQVQLALRLPIISNNARFAIMVRAFENAGAPLRLSDLFDQSMVVGVTFNKDGCVPSDNYMKRVAGYYMKRPEFEREPYYVPSTETLSKLMKKSEAVADFVYHSLQPWGREIAAGLALMDPVVTLSKWHKPNVSVGGFMALECLYANSSFDNFTLKFKMYKHETFPQARKYYVKHIEPYAKEMEGVEARMNLVEPITTIVPIDATPTDFARSLEQWLKNQGKGSGKVESTPPMIRFLDKPEARSVDLTGRR